jgi:hypothetical protein
MNFGLYSDKARDISFESHLSSLEQEPRQILLEIRDFVKSLGSNVIEEIRPHRIVYAKSLTFRTFLDIQPRNNALVISIRKSRTEPASVNTIQSSLQSADIKTQIAAAYTSIKWPISKQFALVRVDGNSDTNMAEFELFGKT